MTRLPFLDDPVLVAEARGRLEHMLAQADADTTTVSLPPIGAMPTQMAFLRRENLEGVFILPIEDDKWQPALWFQDKSDPLSKRAVLEVPTSKAPSTLAEAEQVSYELIRAVLFIAKASSEGRLNVADVINTNDIFNLGEITISIIPEPMQKCLQQFGPNLKSDHLHRVVMDKLEELGSTLFVQGFTGDVMRSLTRKQQIEVCNLAYLAKAIGLSSYPVPVDDPPAEK